MRNNIDQAISQIDHQIRVIENELRIRNPTRGSDCSAFAKGMRDCLSYINTRVTELEQQYLECYAKAKNKKEVKACIRKNIDKLRKFIDKQNRLCKFSDCSEHDISPQLAKCITKASNKSQASMCFVHQYIQPIKAADEKAKKATKQIEKVIAKIKKK